MTTITRLEATCVLVITLILVLLGIDMANRWNEHRSALRDRDDEAALATASAMLTGAETGGAITGADPDFAASRPSLPEQTRRIPSPTSHPAEPVMTNITARASTNETPSTPPPAAAVSTNTIMQELERIAAMPWTPATEQMLQSVVSKWAAGDPMAALQYSMQIESRRVRNALLAGVFNTWAKNDINGAYNWLVANRETDPVAFQAGMRPVFSTLAAANLDNAMRMALDLAPGSDRMSAMRIVVDQASRAGKPDAMVSYLESFQTPGEKQGYASILASSWAVYDPLRAAQWAASLSDPYLRNATMNSAIGMWASDNPTAAAAWVMAISDPQLRTREIAQVTQAWARYDPVKAADWLLAQRPPSPTLDPAIQSLAGTVMKSNPQGAVMWAAAISDPKTRNSTIMSISREWMKSDPASASAYIANSPLSPNQKNRLLHGR